MKPWILLPLALLLSGCASVEPADIAVASYPVAFAVEALAGDDLVVADLASNVALHDFDPSSRDLDQLRQSTHLILWSEGLESWAHRAERSLGSSAPRTFEIIRLPPGEDFLQAEDDHGHDHGHGELDKDPHTWLDPLAMRASVQAVENYLVAWYPEHAAGIKTRAEELKDRLGALHAEYAQALEGCTHDTIVTNHDAYSYLGLRYGFEIFSLHGIEPGSEPSPTTVQKAIQKIKEFGLSAIFIEEGTHPAALRAIQDETGVSIQVLNTLESRPATGDYFDAQTHNLEQLRGALGCP